MIILTQEQADHVRGETSPGHALDPVRLKSGAYVLNEEVLADPAHAKHHDYLASLDTREVAPNEYPE